MARTAVDLPDPMEENKAGGAINSADDLLAQLAGDEIDRLLSEADTDDIPTLAADRAAAPHPQNVDRPVNEAPEAAAAPVAPAAGTPSIDDAVLHATEQALDDLFQELDEDAPAAVAEAAPAAAAAAPGTPVPTPVASAKIKADAAAVAAAVLADPPKATAPVARVEDESPILKSRFSAPAAAATPVEEPASAADDLAAELEADESAHAAALKRMKQAPVAAAVEGAVEVDESEVAYERVPLIVRILEWINAPLAGLSVEVREALGKIALVTTLNAVAVLVYVFLFRRPG